MKASASSPAAGEQVGSGRLRVAYFIDSLAPGGSERSLVELVGPLSTQGIDLDIVVLKPRLDLKEAAEAAGARVFVLPEGGRLATVRAATRHLQQRRPDLVHTTLFEADVAGRIAARRVGLPVVSSLVNILYGPEQLRNPRIRPWKMRAAQLLDATTAQLTTAVHANAMHVAATMQRRLLLSRDKIQVIPRGRDPHKLGERTVQRRRQARAGLGLPEDTFAIVTLARHEFQKGLDLLIEAMRGVHASHPHCRLLIAGREGDQTRALQQAIHDYGLQQHVQLLGKRDDVPELLVAADVFAFPTRWEGFPGSVVEALALEAPIVASGLDAVREVVGDAELALWVPPESPAALADAIRQVIENPAAAAARAAAGRQRFLDALTIERIAAITADFYRRTLASVASGR